MSRSLEALEAARSRRRRRERLAWDAAGVLFFLSFLRLFVDYALGLWRMIVPWM